MPSYQVQKYQQQVKKHKLFLSKFKLFPDKSRKVIYTSLLQLPLNHSHFIQLTKPYKQLPQHTTNRQTSFITHALISLYPSLSSQWLPGLIYPFIKLFQQDSIVCFQISLTFLLNWYQPIFQNYPNTSKKVMQFCRRFLPKLDKKISSICQYTLSSIINPMILVCLTDVLNKEDSLQLLDFLITNPYSPEYFLTSAISIILYVEDELCKLKTIEDISKQLRKEKKINIQQVIIRAKDIAKVHKHTLTQIYNNSLFPLNKQRYPVYQFVKYNLQRKNDAIQKAKYDQMNQLNNQYHTLQKLINHKLKQNIVANSIQIQSRYDKIQAQTIAHLNKMKKQHQIKLKALKQIQQKFKQQINQQQSYYHNNNNKSYDKQKQSNMRNMRIIQRRGRLEKQILKLEQQANKIRLLQEQLLMKINKVTNDKKNQLLETNKKLYHEQREQDLYSY